MKKCERTERGSEQRKNLFEAIVEHSLDAILLADDDGRYVIANPAACELLGYTVDELRARNVWDVTPHGDEEEALLQWRRFLAAGKLEGEYTVRRKDGTLVETEFRAVANVLPGLHASVMHDITDRIRAEESLRESETRFRFMFEESPIPKWIFDRDTLRFLEVNESAMRQYGYSREEFLSITIRDIRPAEQLDMLEQTISRVGHEVVQLGGFQHQRKNGSRLEVEITTQALEYAGEEAVLVLALDVTERKRAQEALHESHTRFRAVADLVPDLLWRADPSGERTWGNKRWREYTGQTPEEAAGYGWADTIHPDDREHTLHAYIQAVGAGEPFRHEQRIRRVDGVYRWFLAEAVPVRGSSGRITQWFGAATDVHEQRTAMDMLERLVEERTHQVRDLASRLTRAEQYERRRISQVLHDDVQQLLYGIEMKMRLASQDAAAGEMERLQEGIAQAEAWLSTAIKTARQLSVDLSPPILKGEGLADAIAWLQRQMKELHGLEIELEAEHSFYIPDEDLRVLLFQIVRELLFNVKKHAGVNRATVRLAEKDEYIIVHVVDEGEGFEMDKFARSEGHTGGFGLSRARERLQLLGGHLKIRSRSGEGTHVEVRAQVDSAQPK